MNKDNSFFRSHIPRKVNTKARFSQGTVKIKMALISNPGAYLGNAFSDGI